MDRIARDGIEVEILEAPTHQLQKVSLTASKTSSMVAALNRGGGRMALLDASPSREMAIAAAKRLGIEVID